MLTFLRMILVEQLEKNQMACRGLPSAVFSCRDSNLQLSVFYVNIAIIYCTFGISNISWSRFPRTTLFFTNIKSYAYFKGIFFINNYLIARFWLATHLIRQICNRKRAWMTFCLSSHCLNNLRQQVQTGGFGPHCSIITFMKSNPSYTGMGKSLE